MAENNDEMKEYANTYLIQDMFIIMMEELLMSKPKDPLKFLANLLSSHPKMETLTTTTVERVHNQQRKKINELFTLLDTEGNGNLTNELIKSRMQTEEMITFLTKTFTEQVATAIVIEWTTGKESRGCIDVEMFQAVISQTIGGIKEEGANSNNK